MWQVCNEKYWMVWMVLNGMKDSERVAAKPEGNACDAIAALHTLKPGWKRPATNHVGTVDIHVEHAWVILSVCQLQCFSSFQVAPLACTSTRHKSWRSKGFWNSNRFQKWQCWSHRWPDYQWIQYCRCSIPSAPFWFYLLAVAKEHTNRAL